MKVVGYKVASFKDKDTNKEIEYGKLYVTYPDENVDGLCCEAISVKPVLLDMVKVGDEVTLSYNKFGKVQEIITVK